ncbi:hypothetical protein [Maribacter algarum]|uniref:hypothetical protein n=1 Tax=Maribacter algarum (ex Zhang et al. 2020) TaxID=2578118 RepID=UPI00110B01FA|nr:hypothetical protein [Maribacter algarum]
MIFRILMLLLIIGLAIFLIRMVSNTSEYKKCQKCDGKGYWRATKGEKDKCDVCQGAGKVLRR